MSPSTEHGEFATELKFLVDRQRAREIQEWIGKRLDADPHAGPDGTYRVTSLYFDTEDRHVYQRLGSYGRSKYRVRQYGDMTSVFLERKMKRKDHVGKRRTLVPGEEMARIDERRAAADWEGQWFHRRIWARELRPVCQVSYSRAAFATQTSLGAVRLTIDSNLRAVPVERAAFAREQGEEIFDKRIVELKFRRYFPAVFQELTRRFLLAPEPVSKYRRAAEVLSLVGDQRLCATY